MTAYSIGQRSGWLYALGSVALLGTWGWLYSLRRARAILDTPTSRIASAAQGYVELVGRGRPLPGAHLLSPMTHLPCLWYQYTLYRRVNNRWRLEGQERSVQPFLLEDATGVCEIDTVGAEVRSTHQETRQIGQMRYVETLLLEGDPIYALGEFHSLGGAQIELDPRADLGALLSRWKRDPGELRARFDQDGDGRISQEEWGQAVHSAREEVSAQHQALRRSPTRHRVARPAHGKPYLITNLDPLRLGRVYARQAWFSLATTLAAWISLLWVLRLPDSG